MEHPRNLNEHATPEEIFIDDIQQLSQPPSIEEYLTRSQNKHNHRVTVNMLYAGRQLVARAQGFQKPFKYCIQDINKVSEGFSYNTNYGTPMRGYRTFQGKIKLITIDGEIVLEGKGAGTIMRQTGGFLLKPKDLSSLESLQFVES